MCIRDSDCTVGCDCDRYIEVWNNVFSQFNNDGQDNYTELKQKNIDTGKMCIRDRPPTRKTGADSMNREA